MIQYVYRQSTWEVFKDFIWWYFIIKCNEFHPSLDLNMKKLMKTKSKNFGEVRDKENRRVANARYRAHRLDGLYKNTVTREV